LGEVDKAMCESVDVSADSFSAFLPSPKYDLVEFKKAMFKEIAYPSELIFYHLKTRFARGRERDVSRGRLALIIHFLPSTQPKMRLGRGRES
jgi:hypothetical protein